MWRKSMRARMITLYIVDLSTKTLRNALFVDSIDSIIEKTTMILRTATETEEKMDLKCVLVLSYHPSFEALVCKQEGVRIVVMTQREA
jgi:hypothetical protein